MKVQICPDSSFLGGAQRFSLLSFLVPSDPEITFMYLISIFATYSHKAALDVEKASAYGVADAMIPVVRRI